MGESNSLLFVLPSVGMGGSTTSLISILNSPFTEKYDVDVFVLYASNYSCPSISAHDVGLNCLTTAFYADYSKFSISNKVKVFPLKILKQNPLIYKLLERVIIKRTVKTIERYKKYKAVIGFMEGEATRFVTYFSNPKKVAWVHCDYAYAFKEKNELMIYSQYSKIVCVSDYTRGGFVKCYPALAKRTCAIHNIFDKDSVIARSREAIDDDRFDNSNLTILSVGRLSAVKRFYLIPKIAKRLLQSGLDFMWYIIGDAQDPVELQKLNDANELEATSDYVIYLGGKINPYPYYKNSDLLVTVSASEACPMIFNEAKILNIPIVSTDFGSAYEFVNQGKDGIITNIDIISDAIIELANNNCMLLEQKSNEDRYDDNNDIVEQLTALFN